MMIDVIKKIYYGTDGDFVEVTVESIQNKAILIGSDRMGGQRKVVYQSEVLDLIEALINLETNYL